MEKTEISAYLEAGRILSGARKLARKQAVPGKSLFELAEEIESQIIEEGGGIAFPVNLSANNNAAHCTPEFGDASTIGEKEVLKIDIGVHVRGFIADSAFTIDFSGENGKLVEAAEKALESALGIAEQGVEIGKIGSEIEKVIKSLGFEPVHNLTGHGLAQWKPHSHPSIPNHANSDSKTLEDGMAIAIEPFACNGKGHVIEAAKVEIFSLEEKKPCRNALARKIISFAEQYNGMPFAERWVRKGLDAGEFEWKVAMREIMQRNILHSYPILHEKQGILVSQSENSLILHDGKADILVK